MKTQKGCLWIGGIAVLLGFIVLCLGAVWWNAARPGNERPVVQALQPQPNASLAAHVPIPVQATARGQRQPIRWLRFYVDNLLSGEQMGTQMQLNGAWTWTPESAGLHTLAFVAANEQGEQNMVSLTVTVLPSADRDGDNLPDEQDSCPDQPAAANQGCPLPNDADNDGLPDEQDACPQEAGRPEDGGCQPANRPDQDGDGVLDADDHCPSLPGRPEWNGCPQVGWALDSDGDGLADTADTCPQQPGPLENNGCPLPQESNRDGDGVPDDQDQCPDQGGSPQNGGCPLTDDRDGDGVPDAQDQCPDSPGWPQFNGCLPEGWVLDRDHDGVPDFLDRCPDERGSMLHWGCSASNDRDGDGVSDAQDQCPQRSGPAGNGGCPHEGLVVIQGENQFCALFPFLCPSQDIDCNADPEACGLAVGCYNDADCDGAPDNADDCPNRFGLGLGEVLDGCPLDWNGNGQPDEGDGDGDGVPDQMDSCPEAQGLVGNSGCPRPDTLELAIELLGFVTNTAFDNFYCYVRLNDSAWTRLPQSGSLQRSGLAYYVNRQFSLSQSGSQPIRIIASCEGQANPLAPVQDLGRLEGAYGPPFWHCNWLDVWSDSGGFFAEFRICER